MNLLDLLKEVIEDLEPKVLKTIPVKPKWKKKHNEAMKLKEKVLKQKEAFWKMVETEAKLKGKLLRYNEEKNVIEVLSE